MSFHFAKFQFAEFHLPVGSGLGIQLGSELVLGSGVWLWTGMGLVLKIRRIEREPDVQTTARSIGGVVLYA